MEQAGADPTLLTKDGESALHIGSKYGHIACVELLLAYGADASTKDLSGKTAIDVASARRALHGGPLHEGLSHGVRSTKGVADPFILTCAQ